MIPKYAEWISSMINFLQKNKKFEWGPDQVLELAKLKKKIVINRPLTMHDPEKQTKLQTDVSNKTIKVMIFQQKKTYHRKQKNVRGGNNIKILATFNTKTKT